MSAEKLALALHERGLIEFGDYKLNSGLWSPYYVDTRPIISVDHRSPVSSKRQIEIRSLVVDAFSEQIAKFDDKKPQHIIAVPEGTTSLTGMIGYMTNRSVVQLRVKEKEHGVSGNIIGDYYEDEKVVWVEDAFTTGGSVLENMMKAAELGLVSAGVAVLVDREQGGISALKAVGVEVESTLKMSEANEILFANEKINPDQYQLIGAYIAGEITAKP